MCLCCGIIKKRKERGEGGSYLTSENMPERIQTLWQEPFSPTQVLTEKVTAGARIAQLGGFLWGKPDHFYDDAHSCGFARAIFYVDKCIPCTHKSTHHPQVASLLYAFLFWFLNCLVM